MDPESAEFQDWEVLQNSDDSVIVKSLDSVGIIRSDYFSLHNYPNNNNNNNLITFTEVVTDEACVEPDTLNSIDPPRPGEFSSHGDCKFSGFDGKNEFGVDENDEPQSGHDRIGEIVGESDNSGEFRSDSSGVGPNLSKIGDFGERTEMGIDENDEPQLGHDGIGEIGGESENSGEFRSDSSGVEPILSKIGDLGETIEMGIAENDEPPLGHAEIGEIVAESENSGEFRSDPSGVESISIKIGDLGETPEMANTENAMEISGGEKIEGESKELNENESIAIEAIKPAGEEEKRRMVWWKLPLDLLRYCAFRVSPVWTVSVAAAVLGFVILGRRLHKMKRKSRSLQLKVTIDDKKVSQFMSKAARLNEAFSVVKRVPVIRPSLPAAGLTPWPVMNLR